MKMRFQKIEEKKNERSCEQRRKTERNGEKQNTD